MIGVTKNMWRKQNGLYSRMNVPTNGLVFYAPLWHPDWKGSPFLAWDVATPGTHTCTVTGATWGATGRTFDGNDSISCGNNASLNITGAISMLSWIKVASSTSYERILWKHKRVSALNQQGYGIQLTDTSVLSAEVKNNANYLVSGTTTLDDNAFHLVGATWTPGTDILLYIDGAAESGTPTGSAPANIGAATEPLYIGMLEFEGSYYYFTGVQGEVLIYNRVLTPVEIDHIYQSTKWRYS